MKAGALLPAVGLLLPACAQDEPPSQRPAEGAAKQAPAAAPKVTGASVMTHVRALQRVADRNGGNRAAGTGG